jgi:hypothetical protein
MELATHITMTPVSLGTELDIHSFKPNERSS